MKISPVYSTLVMTLTLGSHKKSACRWRPEDAAADHSVSNSQIWFGKSGWKAIHNQLVIDWLSKVTGK